MLEFYSHVLSPLVLLATAALRVAVWQRNPLLDLSRQHLAPTARGARLRFGPLKEGFDELASLVSTESAYEGFRAQAILDLAAKHPAERAAARSQG